MSHDIGRMINTHNSAANRTRIGHERSILCFRGMPSAGNAMVMTVPLSAKAKAARRVGRGADRDKALSERSVQRRAHVDEESAGVCAWAKAHDRKLMWSADLCAFAHPTI